MFIYVQLVSMQKAIDNQQMVPFGQLIQRLMVPYMMDILELETLYLLTTLSLD